MNLIVLVLMLVAVVGCWAFGVFVAFCVGGFVTTTFHATDGGLLTFICLALAWSVYYAMNVWRGVAKAFKG